MDEDSHQCTERPGSACSQSIGALTDTYQFLVEPLPISEMVFIVSVNLFCVLLEKDLTSDYRGKPHPNHVPLSPSLPSRYYNQEKGSQQIPSPTTEQKSTGTWSRTEDPPLAGTISQAYCFSFDAWICWVIYILDNEHMLVDFPFAWKGSQEKTLPSMSSKQWNEAL